MNTHPDHSDEIKDMTRPYDQRTMRIIAILEGKIAAQRLELDELRETLAALIATKELSS